MGVPAKKRKETLPTTVNTDIFLQDAGVGVQDLRTEDLAIPFLKVLQKMSPELDDLDVRAGDIFNSVTKSTARIISNTLSGNPVVPVPGHHFRFMRLVLACQKLSAGRTTAIM